MKKILSLITLLVMINEIKAQYNLAGISKTVGLISYTSKTDTSINIGTGTLLYKTTDTINHTIAIFLITNRHVLPSYTKSKSFDFTLTNDSLPGGFVTIKYTLYDKRNILSPDVKFGVDSTDLAVIDVTNTFVINSQILRPLLNTMLPYKTLATPESMRKREIGIGSEVVFMGYPSFFWNEKNVSPILRSGIVATDPAAPYFFSNLYRRIIQSKLKYLQSEKIDGFLIDANVAPGSSGSLVITRPSYISITGAEVGFSESPLNNLQILGILTESYFGIDNAVPTSYRANIGGVISAVAIRKTIDLFR